MRQTELLLSTANTLHPQAVQPEREVTALTRFEEERFADIVDAFDALDTAAPEVVNTANTQAVSKYVGKADKGNWSKR